MRKWVPLIAVCLGTFMLLIDVTIVNVALPDMAIDLQASFSDLQWVVDIYSLALAAFLLASGSLADALGRRRIYVIGLGVFAVSSLACGLAQNSLQLVIARGSQGVGGAAMFATTVALLNVAYRGRDRGVAWGIWGAVSGAAAGLGVILGGVLVETVSWRWIFFINPPLSLLAIVLAIKVFSDATGVRKVRLDLWGTLTFMIAAGSLTYALIRAGEDGWGDTITRVALGTGSFALLVFALVELASDNPLIDLRLFREKRFLGTTVAAFVISLTAFGYLPLVSIWLQTVLNSSPIQAGLILLPLPVVAFIVAGASGKLFPSLDPRWSVGAGITLIGAGVLGMTLLSTEGSWWPLLPGEVLAGIGVGLVSPALVSTALAAVPPERGGAASGLINTCRQLGFALGVATLGTAFQSRVVESLAAVPVDPGGVAKAIGGGGAAAVIAAFPEGVKEAVAAAIGDAFVTGLDRVFVIAGGIGVVGGIVSFILLSAAPRQSEAFLAPRGYVGRHRFVFPIEGPEPAPEADLPDAEEPGENISASWHVGAGEQELSGSGRHHSP